MLEEPRKENIEELLELVWRTYTNITNIKRTIG